MLRKALLVIGLLLASIVPAGATERIVTELLPPFSFADGSKVAGLSTQIVEAAFERAGVPFQVEILPWQRAYETARTQPGTFIYSLTRTTEREGSFQWVGRIVRLGLAVYRLKDRPELKARTLDEVARKGRIAVIYNDSSMLRLKELGVGEDRLFVVNDRAEGAQLSPLVLNRRAAYMVSNPYTLAARIRSGDLPDAFAKVIELPTKSDLYLAANPGTDRRTVERLRSAFEALHAEGTVDRILARFE
jgi:polar amino acid transport system substrate-binding protein